VNSTLPADQIPSGDVLIVDDVEANLRLLANVLTKAGYSVRPAGTASLALRSIQARLPGLILLDVRMPDMDGFELCRRLKAEERTRAIPVIFISASVETEGKLEGFEAGAVDFITKPFNEAEVLARVATHLALHQARQELEHKNAQLLTEVAERKQAELKLEVMATHDYLTGLPSRALLLDRFTVAAALGRRNRTRLAVMSLDLDKFKSINDTLGHDAGDQVLKAVGMRITQVLRVSDTFARVGGDEFISVMVVASQIEDATIMAQKILDSFAEPLSIDGHQLQLSTSIGIAMYPDNAEDLETLTKKSDTAMYYSKDHGRSQFKFYGNGDVRMG
jgi:diguanylate cyclase (GGDEF)-like protein